MRASAGIEMVHTEVRGAARWLRMESGKVQALDLELVVACSGALAAARSAGAPPLVLTGTGGSFSAGVDLFRILDGGRSYIEEFLPALSKLLVDLFTYPAPVVAAINGHAVAGGALLAWCADQCVMASGPGRIGVPELRVGVPFPAAALEVLRFAAGTRGAQRLALAGGTLPADQALLAGTIDAVVEPAALESRAAEIVGRLAAIPSATFRLTKTAIRAPHVDAMTRAERAWDDEVIAVWSQPATLEAIRGYLDRTLR
jgi:enoyl-CoA hydratase